MVEAKEDNDKRRQQTMIPMIYWRTLQVDLVSRARADLAARARKTPSAGGDRVGCPLRWGTKGWVGIDPEKA